MKRLAILCVWLTVLVCPAAALPQSGLESAAAAQNKSQLPSPVDEDQIDQRIDLGATAAGEQSDIPPDSAYGAFQRGYFLTAFALALDRAKAGDPKSETLLGELLSRGLGVKQDFKEAASWYELAAKAGDREALYALAQISLDGRGVEPDPKKAADYFQQAGEKGSMVAWRELAFLLLQGQGRDKNPMLAAAYLRKAAMDGDMDAQFALAGLYSEGVGVAADDAQAARWYAEASKNGHVGAQVEYAILLFNGRGVTKDETLAAAWLQQAAASDNPLAQVRLARLYADGRGVKQDNAQAARWYAIAKAKGFADEYLDTWMDRLDKPARDAARKAADDWLGSPAARVAQAAQGAVDDAPLAGNPVASAGAAEGKPAGTEVPPGN